MEIHDRIPAILHPDDEETWLNCTGNPFEKVAPLLVPFPSNETAHVTTTRVNNSRYNEPDAGAQIEDLSSASIGSAQDTGSRDPQLQKASPDTPEVNQALDVLESYCRPEWRVADFRHNLNPCGESGVDREGQQQVLRAYFGGIHENVRTLLSAQIGMLIYRYKKTHDETVKAELDRLTAELEKLPESWKCRADI
jgi:hypothetical protein